jgi:hypothetical protein
VEEASTTQRGAFFAPTTGTFFAPQNWLPKSWPHNKPWVRGCLSKANMIGKPGALSGWDLTHLSGMSSGVRLRRGNCCADENDNMRAQIVVVSLGEFVLRRSCSNCIFIATSRSGFQHILLVEAHLLWYSRKNPFSLSIWSVQFR